MTTALLEQARDGGTPLVEADQATFVWSGAPVPQLVGDFNEWDLNRPFRLQRSGDDLWSLTLSLPADAYIEYAFVRDGQRLTDPFNGRSVSNGLGQRNHYFYMLEAAPSPLAHRRPKVARGAISRHYLPTEGIIAGRQRLVALYRPVAAAPAALLVVLDGQDYAARGRITAIVDNLTALGTITPLALALVYHHRQARMAEYICSDATLLFIRERVLPLAQHELFLAPPETLSGHYGLLGASAGGLQALYLSYRAPELFGRVLCQAAMFSMGEHDVAIYEWAHSHPAPGQVWLDVDRHDSFLETNRRMRRLLKERGASVHYHEYAAGHNYTAWRNQLPDALATMFAPQVDRPPDRD